ncbi:MAG TPA: S53 family peptidase [Nocardioidaceae bacterium]|nr:S53 family peptidase [Nocardioidaceae bacterium]
MKKAKTSLSAAAVVGALVAAGIVAAPAATAAPDRRPVARTAPTWVARAHSLGTAPASGRSTFRVYLAPRGGTDALKAAVAEVSDPGSAGYRHFVSASQFHATYDATDATVATVRGWLEDNRLSVTSVEAHHRYLAVTGSNAAVQRAFGVSLKRFRHRGHVVQANTSAVLVPDAIAPLVSTVTGLDTTPGTVRHHAPPSDGFRNARPCSRHYGQLKATYQGDFKTPLPKFNGMLLPYAVCGYTGPQLRSAYEGANPAGLDGIGTTVAITDAYASPTIAEDSARYATRHGDAGYRVGQLTQVLPTAFHKGKICDPSGWYGEETLDVEAVHAMAPGAKIRYYASPSCLDDDLLGTLNKVVDQNRASIVSNSWSSLEANESSDTVAAYEGVFLQGALQGIGFLFSSGDNGDELAASGIKQVDYPASDPYATAVGGTSDAIGADGSFLGQTGWGTEKYSLSTTDQWTPVGFTSGAGGGTSGLFNRPDYQQGVVPGRYGAGRAVPDVGLDADPTTGFLVGQTQTFPDGVYYDEHRIGGTSLASPLFAGMTALTEQHAGGRIGFLNPTIYAKAGTKAFSDVKGPLPDVGNVRADYVNSVDTSAGVLYSVRVFNQDSSLATATGWDDVTGVGSPRSSWLTSVK